MTTPIDGAPASEPPIAREFAFDPSLRSVPTEPKKPIIFISYAHADEPEHPAEGEIKWLSFVTGYLRPAIKHGPVVIWIDRLMRGGDDWDPEIERKLRACDIFLLLVSRHSLSSDYVVGKEIAIIRERQAQGEAVHFYPLVLTPTPKIALDLVHDKNLRPRDGKPLSDYPLHERYRHMSDTADEIEEISSNISNRNNMGSSLGRSSFSRPMRSTMTERLAPLPGQRSRNGPTTAIMDLASLESWMKAGGNRVAAKLAARAVLRSLPILLSDTYPPGGLSKPDGELVVSAIFRAASLAQFSGFVPPNVDVLRAWPEAAEAADVLAASIQSPIAAGLARAAASAVRSASSNIAADAVAFAVQAVSHASEAISNTVNSDRVDRVRTALWESIHSDTVDTPYMDATVFARLPLWKGRAPGWANDGWSRLQNYLPPDHGWWIWFEWYEDRLRGGWRGEDYEHVFVNLPKEEWDTGPAAANAWIREHLPPTGAEPSLSETEIKDRESLNAWLEVRSADVALPIAVRAALRVVPRVVEANAERNTVLSELACAVFRLGALAQAAVKYPACADRFVAAFGSFVSDYHAAGPRFVYSVESAAQAAARAVFAGDSFAGASADAVVIAAQAAARASQAAADSTWVPVRYDATASLAMGAIGLMDLPLWSDGGPSWANAEWISLKTLLPKEEGWEVWIDWYEERLRGGSRGEAYELVFASVPVEVWNQGPKVANIWIREHLPLSDQGQIRVQDALDAQVIRADELKESEPRTTLSGLPPPLPDVDSPFTYGWNAKLRIEVIAGAQNLPFYRFFRSEEDHRKTLETCRIGADRLLKSWRDGNYGNSVPRAYAERLAYYVEDLPRAAGIGNILLANDQARILHDMFPVDADMLPADFASALKAVIANQFALNDFYDLVRRHDEAVNLGNWTQPFPFEEAQRFFRAVEDNTPVLFEREVSEGLRQVEQAASPASRAPELTSASAAAVQPPPLPPRTPNAEHSRQRQIAAAANTLWSVFLKGKDFPVAIEGWTNAAHKLGENIGPILDFLRGLGAP